MQVKKQQLELDMEQSKLGKEYVNAVYSNPPYLTLYSEYIMWNPRLDEAQDLESRLPGEIPITSDMQMTPHLRQKAKRN